MEGVHLELSFYNGREPVYTFTEIGTAAADVDLTERCSLQHDLTARRIFTRSSSLVSSDTRMSAFPVLMQAETSGKCRIRIRPDRLGLLSLRHFNKDRFICLDRLKGKILRSMLSYFLLPVVILIL